MESLFGHDCLKKALKSNYEIIAVWGAYQIMRLENEQIRPYLSEFLNAPFTDIQDAGIAKIAEIGALEFLPEILKIFRESDGQIKYSSALVLSRFPNDFSKTLIQKWFEQLAVSDQSTRMEYDVATYAYLEIDRELNFQKVIKTLQQSQHDAIKSSVLFLNLLVFCDNKLDFLSILDQYFVLRELNSDAELTFRLVEHFGQMELKSWWSENLLRGYSISSIYEQCYILLGLSENITDRQYWLDLETAFGSYDRIHPVAPRDHQHFLVVLEKWVEYLLQDTQQPSKLRWVIQSFNKNHHSFSKTIPKILELESLFLLTVPLLIILEKSVSKWLLEPTKYVESIANYYHSSLLIKEYREEILSMFFPDAPTWQPEQLEIVHDYSPLSAEDTRNEILWSFLREEVLGYDIPWPSIFPNPNYSAHLTNGLSQIYNANFEYYIHKQDRVAVDYALQMFQTHPNVKVRELLKDNFRYLIQHHAETLYQTIEYIPDSEFITLLLEKYEPGEFEIARLVFIICEIFDKPVPKNILEDLKNLNLSELQRSGMKKPVRLHCNSCDNTFQYSVEVIYVDEGSILRMNRLSADSVWVPQSFSCKKCASPVPFILDDSQLNEFSLQSRVDRILKITPQPNSKQFGQKIVLIDFPRFEAVTYSPEAFEKLIGNFEQDIETHHDTLQMLWIKQARLYKAMHKWDACLTVLIKIAPSAKNEEELNFLKGLSNYKMENFVQSRVYFDWFIKKYADQNEPGSQNQYFEQSKYFIKAMDTNTSRRSRFTVIKGKK
ncbi:MAG: hypothetical protein HN580_07785 [Deltaproteobacteria bacterium]|nr:hypothetical protein [Deltaproteobacteria bacterium]MBT6615343.1 hypothetical protein [Deltaproteobacteria bacterium]MBT7888904.1 hypothetical protein [Deltaproteobacteria bacterium]